MQFRKWVAVGALALGAAGLAGAAFAADSTAPRAERHVVKHRMHGGPGMHASVEFTAMHNIMAELLSARTGKTAAEIQAMFDKGGPHEVFDQLGLDDDEMRPLFKEARATLITRATKAGLITSAQAEQLGKARAEMRIKRMKGPPPEAPEPPLPPELEDDED